MDEQKKKVDESWKDVVEKEKVDLPAEEEKFIPEANFTFFVTTLGIQIAIALGEVPNPVTNKNAENLDQAKYLIDTLDMLKEKTINNLSKDEQALLENILYDFHIKYVAKNQMKPELKER